jgi:hypothetical protein
MLTDTITIKQYKKISNDRELEKSKKILKRWFNLYRRLSGFSLNLTNEEITGHCIACNKVMRLERFSDGSIMNGKDFHASHLYDSDKYPNIEFLDDNVWLSCNRCNSPYGLHGNKNHYMINLLKKIGQERFDRLILAKNTIKKINILEIDRMISEYKNKCKTEAKRLGIKL